MHYECIAFVIVLLVCTVASIASESSCYDVYRHGCGTSLESSVTELGATESHGSCSLENVGDDVKFTVLLDENGSSLAGLAELNITLPNVDCNYDIALLVNSSVTNEKDCNNNVFHETNSHDEEVHSIDRKICVVSDENETSQPDCQKESWSMWYEHIFTGCYALRFTVDGYKYSVRGNTFLVTDYRRTEVTEPKFTCYHEDRRDTELGTELVRFVLRISLLASTPGMRLTLVPMSGLPDENKENACNPYTENPLQTWEIITGDTDSALKNCTQFGNEKDASHMDCDLLVRVPREANYCFKIILLDVRCHRQTLWNPPPASPNENLLPCTWLQSCPRITKNPSAIEKNGFTDDNDEDDEVSDKRNYTNDVFLATILTTVIPIAIVMTVAILYARRIQWTSDETQSYVFANNSRNIKLVRCNDGEEPDSVETTDDENVVGNLDVDDNHAILLLYARGSSGFMSVMTDFGEILKIHCGCRVRDWYAASELDDVATIGPAAWVDNLLRQNNRTLWIDTPRARSLLDFRERNNRSRKTSQSCEGFIIDDEAISDFRDLALPSVLDLAKKNVSNLTIQYSRHYVVRLEGFDDTAHRSKDPFEDLSPHTRYLIPYHLSELCSHISSRRKNLDAELLKTEEIRLRESLARIRDE